jgi:hypothetical protein
MVIGREGTQTSFFQLQACYITCLKDSLFCCSWNTQNVCVLEHCMHVHTHNMCCSTELDKHLFTHYCWIHLHYQTVSYKRKQISSTGQRHLCGFFPKHGTWSRSFLAFSIGTKLSIIMLPTYDVKHQDIMKSRLEKKDSLTPSYFGGTIQKISKITFMTSNHMTLFH